MDQYLKNNPGRKASERFAEVIKANAETFRRLAEDLKYEMKLDITGDGAFLVQFSSPQGQVYTTYTFHNAVVAA